MVSPSARWETGPLRGKVTCPQSPARASCLSRLNELLYVCQSGFILLQESGLVGRKISCLKRLHFCL